MNAMKQEEKKEGLDATAADANTNSEAAKNTGGMDRTQADDDDGGEGSEKNNDGAPITQKPDEPSPSKPKHATPESIIAAYNHKRRLVASLDERSEDMHRPPHPYATNNIITTTTTNKKIKTKKKMKHRPLTNIAGPGPNDCLFGRGGGTNHNPGNKLYRQWVDAKRHTYVTSERTEKPLVAMEIVRAWRNLHPPGRFLKQDADTKSWYDVGDKAAREKTSQTLRELRKASASAEPKRPRKNAAKGKDGKARGVKRRSKEEKETTASPASSLSPSPSSSPATKEPSDCGDDYCLEYAQTVLQRAVDMPPREKRGIVEKKPIPENKKRRLSHILIGGAQEELS